MRRTLVDLQAVVRAREAEFWAAETFARAERHAGLADEWIVAARDRDADCAAAEEALVRVRRGEAQYVERLRVAAAAGLRRWALASLLEAC